MNGVCVSSSLASNTQPGLTATLTEHPPHDTSTNYMTSPPVIYHKNRTNDPLTVQESTLVRKALAGTLKKIDTLDNEISRLHERFNTLSLKQRELNAFLEGHRSLLSPARRLLPEILQEIFCHCLPTSHNAVMSINEAPLILGRVCSRWRQVAYSTPRLWTSIHIVAKPPSSSQQVDVAMLCAISAWLSRSGTLPLSISLVIPDTVPCRRTFNIPNNAKVRPYLDVLTPYTHRWQSIHYTTYASDLVEFFNRFRAPDLPLLECLHVTGFCHDPRSPNTTALSGVDSILRAPRLHALSMPQYWSRMLELPVRWKDLTSLDLRPHSSLRFADVAKVLTLCPELRTCAILVVTPGRGGPEVPPTSEMTNLILPNLQTLCVANRSIWSENTYRLFENLVAPALRHLTYSRTVYSTPSRPVVGELESDRLSSSLQSFLQNLDHPLEELKFSARDMGNAIDILSLVPGLKRLSLAGAFAMGRHHTSSGFRANDPMLARLTPGSDGQKPCDLSPDNGGSLASACLCPKLEVLHCVGTKFSNCKLLEFLRSRTVKHREYGVSHLRRVSVSLSRQEEDDSQDVDMWRDVEMLAKETGVMVNLDYYGPPVKKSYRKSTTQATKYSPFDGLNRTVVLAPRLGWERLRYFGF